MLLNFLPSKTFFGTESIQESQELLDALKQANIRCTCDTFSGKDTIKHYSHDPFHVYAKSYLMKLAQFHIIRVHILDYKKAIDIYNNNF